MLKPSLAKAKASVLTAEEIIVRPATYSLAELKQIEAQAVAVMLQGSNDISAVFIDIPNNNVCVEVVDLTFAKEVALKNLISSSPALVFSSIDDYYTPTVSITPGNSLWNTTTNTYSSMRVSVHRGTNNIQGFLTHAHGRAGSDQIATLTGTHLGSVTALAYHLDTAFVTLSNGNTATNLLPNGNYLNSIGGGTVEVGDQVTLLGRHGTKSGTVQEANILSYMGCTDRETGEFYVQTVQHTARVSYYADLGDSGGIVICSVNGSDHFAGLQSSRSSDRMESRFVMASYLMTAFTEMALN